VQISCYVNNCGKENELATIAIYSAIFLLNYSMNDEYFSSKLKRVWPIVLKQFGSGHCLQCSVLLERAIVEIGLGNPNPEGWIGLGQKILRAAGLLLA
jgi:hypothetical protein